MVYLSCSAYSMGPQYARSSGFDYRSPDPDEALAWLLNRSLTLADHQLLQGVASARAVGLVPAVDDDAPACPPQQRKHVTVGNLPGARRDGTLRRGLHADRQAVP